MENLVRTLGVGVFSYHPFKHNNFHKLRRLLSLQELCKRIILQRTTLRGLKGSSKSLPLPSLLLKYLTTLSTDDFSEIECAPFTDIFNINFYFRALTYRVYCHLDKKEYLATYGALKVDDSFDFKDWQKWVNSLHCQVLPIYAAVTDEITGNVFYLLDMPESSLEHLEAVMFNYGLGFSEKHIWQLVYQLSSSLESILSTGLIYGPFGLENIFLIENKLYLENELTRKTHLETSYAGDLFNFYDKNGEHKTSVSSSKDYMYSEVQAIRCLGRVIKILLNSYCEESSSVIPSEDSINDLELDKLFETCIYSPVLLRLVVDSQDPLKCQSLSLAYLKNLAKSLGCIENNENCNDLLNLLMYASNELYRS